jgi:5-formyltetrahydrofolate cyclo-ligase
MAIKFSVMAIRISSNSCIKQTDKYMAFLNCLTTKKNSDLAKQRSQLRQQCRAARRALPSYKQYAQAKHLSDLVKRCPEFIHAKSIASYLPNDGEIDTAIIHQLAWALGKRIYLPVPTKHKSLNFMPYTRQTPLVTGQWGIKEPRCAAKIATQVSLDLILVPLVAFDNMGNRLGRGGGYYDRFLANAKRQQRGLKTLGLSHTLQQVDNVPAEAWDITLNAIATPRKMFRIY